MPGQPRQGSPGGRTAGSTVCSQTQPNCPCLPFQKKSTENNKCEQKRKNWEQVWPPGSPLGKPGSRPLLGLVPQRQSQIKPQCKTRVHVRQGPDAVPAVCVQLGGTGGCVTGSRRAPHPPRLANRQQTSACHVLPLSLPDPAASPCDRPQPPSPAAHPPKPLGPSSPGSMPGPGDKRPLGPTHAPSFPCPQRSGLVAIRQACAPVHAGQTRRKTQRKGKQAQRTGPEAAVPPSPTRWQSGIAVSPLSPVQQLPWPGRDPGTHPFDGGGPQDGSV